MTIPAVPMQLLTSNDETSADLYIMGNISRGGWFGKKSSDTDANDVAQALMDLPKTVTQITVHINSFGGEVAEGIGIYNALRAHPAEVTTVCEGFACSIASVVFMAGAKRVMRPASMLMLHNASMYAQGTPADLRKAAQDLETITELSKTAYLMHATDELTPEKLTEVMDAETWVKPETAVEWGLATEIDNLEETDEPSQSAAALVMRRLAEAPGEFLAECREQEGVAEALEALRADIAGLREIVQARGEDEPGTEDPDDDDEPGAEDPDDDEDAREQRYEPSRLARMFGHLADNDQ